MSIASAPVQSRVGKNKQRAWSIGGRSWLMASKDHDFDGRVVPNPWRAGQSVDVELGTFTLRLT